MNINDYFRIATKEDFKKSKMFDKQVILESVITDFAILLGGKSRCETNDGKPIGNWWLDIPYDMKHSYVVNYFGRFDYESNSKIVVGIKPVVNYSVIKDFCKKTKNNYYNFFEVEYGKYPKSIVPEEEKRILEEHFQNGTLEKTKNSYYVNNGPKRVFKNYFEEYIYNNERFIRILTGELNYVKVEPLKWIVDKKNNLAITKDIVVVGIPFTSTLDNDYGNQINDFLNTHFKCDIISEKEYVKTILNKDEIDVYVKLSGDRNKIINALKLISEEVEVSLEENKKELVRSNSHYGYRRKN